MLHPVSAMHKGGVWLSRQWEEGGEGVRDYLFYFILTNVPVDFLYRPVCG